MSEGLQQAISSIKSGQDQEAQQLPPSPAPLPAPAVSREILAYFCMHPTLTQRRYGMFFSVL